VFEPDFGCGFVFFWRGHCALLWGLWAYKLWIRASTLSAGKFFCGMSCAFLFVFWALFAALIGVTGSVVWCFVVRFNIVCGAVSCWFA
jgi:hypothetical protein